MNGVLAVSCSGAVTRANKAFLELFPELGADFIDAPYREALGPVLAPMIERMEKALEERGSLSGVELGYGERVIEVYGSAMFDETGSRNNFV